MTWTELGTKLKAITVSNHTLPFAHFAWSSAPSGDYGVYGEDLGTNQFDADDRYAERTIRGSVDWFTRTDDLTAFNAIESCFKNIQNEGKGHFAWYLNTIQYEDDTHFIHYEWIVEVG